jgi:hypothetical protein
MHPQTNKILLSLSYDLSVMDKNPIIPMKSPMSPPIKFSLPCVCSNQIAKDPRKDNKSLRELLQDLNQKTLEFNRSLKDEAPLTELRVIMDSINEQLEELSEPETNCEKLKQEIENLESKCSNLRWEKDEISDKVEKMLFDDAEVIDLKERCSDLDSEIMRITELVGDTSLSYRTDTQVTEMAKEILEKKRVLNDYMDETREVEAEIEGLKFDTAYTDDLERVLLQKESNLAKNSRENRKNLEIFKTAQILTQGAVGQ